MRISLVLLFVAVLQLQAGNGYAQKTKVSITMQNATVEQVLNKIEATSDFVFLFNDNTVDKNRIVSVRSVNKNIKDVLNELFKDTNIAYSIVDKQIILSSRKAKRNYSAPTAAPQQSATFDLKGLVKDASGEPLIGVSVVVVGQKTGAVSDADGKFSIRVKKGDVLEFRYMGFANQRVTVTDGRMLSVTMKEDTQVLKEVVVTAMGIERKASSLTYATQQMGGQELTRNRDVNFINSLQGKSAGLLITPNSSGAGGGSSRIILRGQSSMLGNTQPLIVLDGIPLSNGMSGQTTDLLVGTSRDGGDVLSTINPDDVASMSILKGPNAAALYGSAANNGVIIITTKGGREGKVRVDFTSNVTFESPLVYPKQQTEYAPEITGSNIEYNGWGGKIANLTDEQLATFPYLTRNPRNNVTDFFKTGQTYTHSIALSSGTENSSNYFSYSNTIQKGMIERNNFYRHNLMYKQSYSLFNKKLKIDMQLSYSTQKTENRPIIGKAKGVLAGLYRTPAAVDLRYFDKNRTVIATANDAITQTVVNDKGQVTQLGNSHLIGQSIQNFPWLNQSWINNPYFMINAMDDQGNLDRIMAMFTAKYDIMEGLQAQARFSMDKQLNDGTVIEYATIRRDKDQSLAATYWNSRSKYQELYADGLLTYKKQIKNISLNATGGMSLKRISSHSWYTYKYNDSTYVEPNIAWPNPSWNGSQNPNDKGRVGAYDSYLQKNWETSIFATASVGFWEKGYVDLSWRTDWNKAFQQFATKGHKGFSYWSVGGNLLLKEVLPFKMPDVDNLKLRASYSVVGNSIPDQVYSSLTKNPLTGAYSSTGVEFYAPKPETTDAFEFGLDGSFFGNKLDFDLTLYQTIMKNQFLYVSSGTVSIPANTGKVRNRGIEFTANYHARFGRDFRWTTGINMAYNTNKILSTYTNKETGAMEELEVGPQSLGIKSKFIVGGSYGDLYGKDFKYKNGKIVLTSDGVPVMESNYTRFIGNTTAKFNFGWNNTFAWKNFSLYMLIDGKIGGKILSITESEMDEFGLSQRSAEARDNNNGMVELPDGQLVTARNYYTATGGEQFNSAFDATNLRMREISLGYTFYDLFGPTKNLSVSFIGRNLFFIYKNSPVDPDMSASAANAVSGIESFSLPTTRSFGFNVKLSF